MTPAARHQAAIDILDQIAGGQAAEQALTRWARGARYAGSKDRAAVRDIVFAVLRARQSCAVLGGGTDGRALVLGLLRMSDTPPDEVFTGAGHAPAPLTEPERGRLAMAVHGLPADLPEWLVPDLQQSLAEMFPTYCETMRRRAPVFLRVNALKTTPDQALASLAAEGIACTPHPDLPGALRVDQNARKVAQSAAYRDGLVELQDAASQAIVAGLPLAPGSRVLDYCAGGGGKTLGLAAAVNGPVAAWDVDTHRMADLPARAARAGAEVTVLAQPEGPYDLILCDAPCSGSGTWRRAPEGKWRLTRAALDDLLAVQLSILTDAARRVAPGGALAYATCSVLTAENRGATERFLGTAPEWQVSRETTLLPGDWGDGFYLAVLTRR
ncbi:RsmB/NOP family class I SAM-dependent RNA methyltransferase [Mesobacterium sp. TK19101]|uniref:RsmB/NOP family class I SAM-dependent RNA methyltransferase n=1 Tax=Mesobacterium hydrothermale TaxID=3111907 RepID=A0ABU6HJR3_9RHOB|nr:RsmB/NOP family class I SAM-dependent RNA methyltransferase [Mesobacterium sp. TK19101]MEC3862134.1 RsmB/NOP family class I SAM-dependent RNA methyltransferase [Mesobacterium sp. TK19101]